MIEGRSDAKVWRSQAQDLHPPCRPFGYSSTATVPDRTMGRLNCAVQKGLFLTQCRNDPVRSRIWTCSAWQHGATWACIDAGLNPPREFQGRRPADPYCYGDSCRDSSSSCEKFVKFQGTAVSNGKYRGDPCVSFTGLSQDTAAGPFDGAGYSLPIPERNIPC
jgi:hypothetical protein